MAAEWPHYKAAADELELIFEMEDMSQQGLIIKEVSKQIVDAALGDGDPEKQDIADAWKAFQNQLNGDGAFMTERGGRLTALLDGLEGTDDE